MICFLLMKEYAGKRLWVILPVFIPVILKLGLRNFLQLICQICSQQYHQETAYVWASFFPVSLHLGFRVYHTTGILWSQCCDKIQYMCRSGWWQWARQSQFQWFRKYMTVDIAILEKIMCKSFLRKHHRLTAHWPISEQCSCNLWNFHFCWGLRQSLLLPLAISTYSCDKQLQLPERAEKPYSLNCWASNNVQAASCALCFQCFNFNQAQLWSFMIDNDVLQAGDNHFQRQSSSLKTSWQNLYIGFHSFRN